MLHMGKLWRGATEGLRCRSLSYVLLWCGLLVYFLIGFVQYSLEVRRSHAQDRWCLWGYPTHTHTHPHEHVRHTRVRHRDAWLCGLLLVLLLRVEGKDAPQKLVDASPVGLRRSRQLEGLCKLFPGRRVRQSSLQQVQRLPELRAPDLIQRRRLDALREVLGQALLEALRVTRQHPAHALLREQVRQLHVHVPLRPARRRRRSAPRRTRARRRGAATAAPTRDVAEDRLQRGDVDGTLAGRPGGASGAALGAAVAGGHHHLPHALGGVAAAAAGRGRGGRRVVGGAGDAGGGVLDELVDETAELVVAGVRGLLHPEEALLRHGEAALSLELQDVHAAGRALLDLKELGLVGKDHEVVLDDARVAVAPLQVDEALLACNDDLTLACVRAHGRARAVHLARTEREGRGLCVLRPELRHV
eukprot:Rhum_TRINITY_DN14824_c20_g1::Rhum_TRINITY_DN14824_c20_g1_i1::g.119521::m.119521